MKFWHIKACHSRFGSESEECHNRYKPIQSQVNDIDIYWLLIILSLSTHPMRAEKKIVPYTIYIKIWNI